MKSKPILYLLAFTVLFIWGIILFRIFLSISDKDEGVAAGSGALPPRKVDVPKLYADTFKLQLNYPDPFTGTAAIKSDTSDNKKIKVLVPPMAGQSEINPVQQIKYLGYVRDRREKSMVVIVSYNGKEKMMKRGDTIASVTLTSIGRQEIMMRFKGKLFTVKTE